MGAFHEGHLSLMRRARELGDFVVTSLFVNPTQFGPNEDFTRYPRQESSDFELAESVGVDAIFAPPPELVYPPHFSTWITVDDVSAGFEGDVRPGHFRGVATVVAKLFNMVQPQIAVFGLKDLQQCAVIARMVQDLNVPISLDFVETIREEDGLALSSRNVYLDATDRATAGIFAKKLEYISSQLSMLSNPADASRLIEQTRQELVSEGLSVDYLVIVDPLTMKECESSHPGARVMAAVRCGPVRLLDNRPIQ